MSLALRLTVQQLKSTSEVNAQQSRDAVGTLDRALASGDLSVLTSGTIFPKTAKDLIRRDAIRESVVSDAMRKTVEQVGTPSVAALFALPAFKVQKVEAGLSQATLELQNKISAALINGATEMTPEMRDDLTRYREALVEQAKASAAKIQEAGVLMGADQGREPDPFEDTMLLLSVNMMQGVSEMWADIHGITPIVYAPVSDAELEEVAASLRSEEAVLAEAVEFLKAEMPQDDADLGM